MTEKTQPTDALAKLRHLYANMINGGVRDTASAKRIAEGLLSPAIEALEKWGTPAVAGEPVAWLSTDCIGERYLCFTKPKDSNPARPLVFGDTTPQPTQAQAVPISGAKSFQTYAEANAYSKGYYAGKKAAKQAQAGAVPLTCEWAHNEDDGFWETACGQSWRFDDGGPKENHMNFCHCCGKPLRIKGGQHGN